jgi:L-gulonate 5-dehydrogenase
LSTRKVLLEGARSVHVVDEEPPAPSPGEARVRLRMAGICGSDLAAYRGTSALIRYPRVLGHEVLFDIIEAPDRPDLAGKRAVLDPMVACGDCHACHAGRTNCCARLQVRGVHIDGGMRDVWSVPASSLFAVPDGMSDETAVLAEPLTIAYHAVRRADIQAGQIALAPEQSASSSQACYFGPEDAARSWSIEISSGCG